MHNNTFARRSTKKKIGSLVSAVFPEVFFVGFFSFLQYKRLEENETKVLKLNAPFNQHTEL